MKKWSKKALGLLLAASMILGLGACGGDGTNESVTSTEDAKKYVYRMQDIEVDALNDDASVYGQFYADGRVYLLTVNRQWDEKTGIVVELTSFKEDGTDLQTVELMNTLMDNPNYIPPGDEPEDMPGDEDIMPLAREEGEADTPEGDDESPEEETEDNGDGDNPSDRQIYRDTYVSTAVIDKNGVYMVLEDNSYSYDNNDNYISEGYALTLYSYDLTGKERFQAVLNDNQDEYMWISNIASDENGNLALLSEQTLYMFDAQGNPVGQTEMSDNGGYVQNAFVGKDGNLLIVSYNNDWTKMFLQVYNFQKKAFEENIDLPGNLTNYGMRAGVNYDLILTNSLGLYGYNIGDKEVTPLLSYINSDINGDTMDLIMEAGENRFICSYRDEENWDTHFAVMNYVAPEDIPDKKVLTLACYYLDWNMRSRVVAFNKENEQYRITVKDYSSYSTQEDWSAGYTQLNNDIISGQIPDILVLDSYSMPVSSYISKGILADIGKLIDEDEELNREDFMTNVFDAYSVNGTLYSIIPSFNINTVIGKTADVGPDPGWTMADLRELMNKYPQASVFGDTMTRDNIIWQMMLYSGASYVNKDSGKCNFNTQEFIDILEFAAQFPEKINWDDMDDSYYNNYSSQYREGRTLLMSTSINDFRDFNRNMRSFFGEPITFIGFPCQDGIGAVVNAYEQYAIAAKSPNIEGAWEFLRYYLTEDYQSSNDLSWTIPVSKKALLEKLEEAQERPSWTNEDGTKEYYDDYYYEGDVRILIEPMTKEEADKLFEYISSVNMAYSYDENLMNIITEEAAPFFAGQKSASAVVDIIQNRAQVYLNESKW